MLNKKSARKWRVKPVMNYSMLQQYRAVRSLITQQHTLHACIAKRD